MRAFRRFVALVRWLCSTPPNHVSQAWIKERKQRLGYDCNQD